MKKILLQFEKLTESITAEIEKREEFYNNLSEKRQDSEKGEEYQEHTDRLQEMLDQISEYQEEIGSW